MPARLAVGLATNCTAPLRLELLSLRLFRWLGVDSLLVPDHYLSFVPRSVWRPEATPAAKVIPSPDAFFDPFVMLGTMAARLRRVRLGTGVTEPIRRHPATLAQAFVTLDHLTRGRAILGIGNGERENVEPYGLSFAKRVARLEEALAIVRLLWASGGEPVDFDGAFWRLRRALLATPLYGGRAPTVWVAAHAPRMLALTGRYGDGWYPTVKMTPADYAGRLACIRAARAEAGRAYEPFEPAMLIQVVLGRDRASALAALGRLPLTGALAMLLPGALWKRHGLAHPLGEAFEGFPDFVPEEIGPDQIAAAQRQVTAELLADGIVAGSVADVVAEVRALVGAGLRHLVMWNLTPLVSGGAPADLIRLALLLRRLRAIPLPV